MADTTSFRDAIRKQTSTPALYHFDDWKAAFPNLEQIDVHPRYHCDESLSDTPYAFMQLLAARVGATINTSYVARPSNDCSPPDGETAELQPGKLFVGLQGQQSKRPNFIEEAIAAGSCRTITLRDQPVLMCSNDPGVNWDALGSIVQPARP